MGHVEIATSLYTPEPSGVRLRSTFVASLDLISKGPPADRADDHEEFVLTRALFPC